METEVRLGRGMTWDGDSTMFCVHVVIDEVSLYSLYYRKFR